MWLDSDTLVMNSLDGLFNLIETDNGFFIKENNNLLYNGIFGSKPNTPLMIEWKKQMRFLLDIKSGNTDWLDIGNDMLMSIYAKNAELYDNYTIFNGLDNMYPVNWDNCVTEFIDKPYDNYKKIIREYQPLVVLVNSVYKKLEDKTVKEILDGNMPLNYFINKSFKNMKLIDYDFIEIGTSNFDTLIQSADDNTKGISVDAVKYYIDQLPDKLNVKKINVGISNVKSSVNVYYIPEAIIDANNLPHWFKGCNCINNYHPLHIEHNVSHLCKIEKVNVIPTYELFYQNNVRNVKYLKIDTEGHDCIILKTLFHYIKNLPNIFYPNKIQFETNEHAIYIDVDEIIQLYCSIGYKLEYKGYDTIITYNISTPLYPTPDCAKHLNFSKNIIFYPNDFTFISNTHKENNIPKIIHLIWVGDKDPPHYFETHIIKWKELMTNWEIRIWRNEDISLHHFPPDIIKMLNTIEKGAQKADIMRYFIIEKYGGVYLDSDITPHRSLDPLINIKNAKAIVCHDLPLTWQYISIGFFAAEPHHPLFKLACQLCYKAKLNTCDIHMHTGPRLLGESVAMLENDEIVLLPSKFFYMNEYYDGRFGHHFYAKDW